jgi:lantibiotic modifying enzyme
VNRSEKDRWQPILEGELAERAYDTIQVIAGGVRASQGEVGASLAAGHAGMALLFRYLEAAEPTGGHGRWARRFLEQAVDAVENVPMGTSLYAGFSGVAWVAQHLQGRSSDGEPDGEDVNEAVDQAVLEHLDRSPWRWDYDLVRGLVGLGAYALERLPGPIAKAILTLVIERLAEIAVPAGEGLTFYTPPVDEYRSGYHDLGVAHGVAGISALLGAACAAGIAEERARPLLRGVLRWLWAQRLPKERWHQDPSSIFPAVVGPDFEPEPSRTAWCYGDLGIAVAVLLSARSSGEPEWEARALWLARHVAERPAERTGVVDAGLCHGAAGLGHLFNRLFQATRDEEFRDSARLWFARALDLPASARSHAGALADTPLEDGEARERTPDPGVLTGASGIALALLGATTPIEPSWDRMMLMSLPPR